MFHPPPPPQGGRRMLSTCVWRTQSCLCPGSCRDPHCLGDAGVQPPERRLQGVGRTGSGGGAGRGLDALQAVGGALVGRGPISGRKGGLRELEVAREAP